MLRIAQKAGERCVHSCRKRSRRFWVWSIVVLLLFGTAYAIYLRPPTSFPTGERVRIQQGATLSEAAYLLAKEDVIRSRFMLKALVFLFAGDDRIVSGEYVFNRPLSVAGVAFRVARGKYGAAPARVTVPEGAHAVDIARLMRNTFPDFDVDTFVREALEEQGYLFPDTYHFVPTPTSEQVVDAMRRNFDEQIEALSEEIAASGHSLHDVLTMASILEKEASTMADRRMIADVLWRRIDLGMPLQVDAVFLHINGKNTFELTYDDLASDSLYNTYKQKGLPPGPITNPGLDSILAALNPKPNPYLFYLSDYSGNTYYSETFAQHKVYKRRYLQ